MTEPAGREQRAVDKSFDRHDAAALRARNIRVIVEHDMEKHIDRCVALINGTSELNFTKKRLPEDLDAARQKFRADYVKPYMMQLGLGLVRVIDDTDDYGFCGFYAYDFMFNRMDQFCFSSSILGLGVEQWLYARLSRRPITINGEVASRLDTPADVDWISYCRDEGEARNNTGPARLGSVFLFGGCEMTATAHYLGLVANSVVGEYNVFVSGRDQRYDHSNFLRYGLEGISPEAVRAMSMVGFDFNKHRSKLRQLVNETEVFMFSFSSDFKFGRYRHLGTGAEVPMHIGRQVDFRRTDLTIYTDQQLQAMIEAPSNRKIVGILREQFEFVGPTDRAQFMQNLATVMVLIGEVKPVILLTGWEGHAGERHAELNQWLAEAAARYPNVIVLNINDCIHHKSEIKDGTHFDRKVYYRIAEKVAEIVEGLSRRAGIAAQLEGRETAAAES